MNASTDSSVRGGEIYFKNQLPLEKETLIYASHELMASSKKIKTPPMEVPRQNQLKPEVTQIIRDLKRNHNLFSSGELAKNIARSWKVPQSQIRHIRQAPFFVISHTHMPSILIELGFITNKEEATRLKEKSYQTQLAQSIYKGLKNYTKSIRQNSH